MARQLLGAALHEPNHQFCELQTGVLVVIVVVLREERQYFNALPELSLRYAPSGSKKFHEAHNVGEVRFEVQLGQDALLFAEKIFLGEHASRTVGIDLWRFQHRFAELGTDVKAAGTG